MQDCVHIVGKITMEARVFSYAQDHDIKFSELREFQLGVPNT